MTRDYDAERYNRRTRAMEKQADAVARIAAALEVSALAAMANASAGGRNWTDEYGKSLMTTLKNKAERL